MRAFDRLLVKVPEHTWGVAQSWFLPDYVNWTNAQFDRARAQQPLGFIADNTHHGAFCTLRTLSIVLCITRLAIFILVLVPTFCCLHVDVASSTAPN